VRAIAFSQRVGILRGKANQRGLLAGLRTVHVDGRPFAWCVG
jgi:hypothetical protein